MKLSMEDIKRYQAGEYNVECTKGIIKPSDRGMVHNLCDTIEALQQENEIFRADITDANVQMVYRDKVIGELKAQNERFKNYKKDYGSAIEILAEKNMQNALYVEALKQAESYLKVIEQATEYVKPGTGVWHTVGIALGEIHEALSAAPTTYRNPADVEALKQAREILQDMVDVAEKCGSAYLYRRDTEKVIILLKQIAEVIGE